MYIHGKGLEEFNIHFKTSRQDLFLEVAKVCEAVTAKDEDQTPFEENASQGPVEKHSRPACTLLEVLNAMPNEQKVRLFIEGEENGFAYEFDSPVTKWISEEAVTDYLEDYLQDEFKEIAKKYGVEPTIDFDYDGEIPQVVFGVDLTACI